MLFIIFLYIRWDDDILSSVAELAAFWASLSIEDKWALTEISTSELFQIMKTDQHWEILRLAYESVYYFFIFTILYIYSIHGILKMMIYLISI